MTQIPDPASLPCTCASAPCEPCPRCDAEAALELWHRRREYEAGERSEGPTPAGGAYAIAYWRDDDGWPCASDEAATVEVVEYDEDGRQLARTYARLDGPA